MGIKQQIDQNLKTAMLAGEKTLVTTLRGLKSAILYAEVANGSRESGGLSDPEVMDILAKESKKRQESADLYKQGGDEGRERAELDEKKMIDAYLPEQLSEDEVKTIVDKTIAELGATDMQAMGRVMATVKERTKGAADGATVARIVKEKLST